MQIYKIGSIGLTPHQGNNPYSDNIKSIPSGTIPMIKLIPTTIAYTQYLKKAPTITVNTAPTVKAKAEIL